MNIAIVNTQAPFIYGGAEFLADSLAAKLQECGHRAEIVRIPFKWYPSDLILSHVLACRLLRITSADRVIALKFPAYCLPHENKVLWLLHQFRQAYDLWGTPYQDIPNSAEGRLIREAIIQADNAYLAEAKRIYTNSKIVSGRLHTFNGLSSTVLYPPLIDPDRFYSAEASDYIFFPSRITRAKRQFLAIESMKYVTSKARLVIAGPPDSPSELTEIEALMRKYGVSHKVQLIGNWISQQEKADLFAKALGCLYIPFNEDSYGYVSLEAFQSRKPVITCADSGGTLEIVENDLNGFVVPPDPVQIGTAIDRLFGSPHQAEAMGAAGYERMREMGICWDNVIEALTR